MPVCLIAEPIHPAGVALLEAAGVTVRHASTPRLERIPDELREIDAIIVRTALPAEAIDAAPRLAVIANHGTGTDGVAVAHAHALGIPVAFTPTANVRAVAEHALMLMLAVARQAVQADQATRAGDAGFRFTQRSMSLYGKTLGIVGFGHTGRLLAEMAQGLGLRILVCSPNAPAERLATVEVASDLEQLLQESDVISLHRPLRADSRHLINARTLALMKPGAILVNTSRGGLVDEDALAEALREGRLFGAGLDVLAHEPMRADSPLRQLPNLVLSPHTAGSTREALLETASQCARNVIDALNGVEPAHLVDPTVWPGRRIHGL